MALGLWRCGGWQRGFWVEGVESGGGVRAEGGVIKLPQGSGCWELEAELVEGVGGGGDVAVKTVLRQFTTDSSLPWVYRP